MQELQELCNEAYENSRIYKAKLKAFHDKNLSRKSFYENQKHLKPYIEHDQPAAVISMSLSQLSYLTSNCQRRPCPRRAFEVMDTTRRSLRMLRILLTICGC
ncbi:unnamed protein product [Spirodela intermedia]|uniref:Uncharacterized protein n=1 Tax=Spirodela intermedia TaxID=51605 RepID=A0ABN7EB64_SPIIN|nr:unnamed protein product [Spirodela intermedia]